MASWACPHDRASPNGNTLDGHTSPDYLPLRLDEVKASPHESEPLIRLAAVLRITFHGVVDYDRYGRYNLHGEAADAEGVPG